MVYVISNNRIGNTNDKKPNQNLDNQNLHNSLKFFMIYSQILGLFSLNCLAKSYTDLQFKWKSFRVFYTILIVLLSSFAVLACAYNLFINGYAFSDIATYVFYIGAVVILILFLRLSRRWPALVATWCQMDKIMNSRYGYPPSLNRRLTICSTIFLTLELVEYVLSIYNRYIDLKNTYGKNYEYKKYFLNVFPQLYLLLPVNIITAIYCSLLNTYVTFIQAFNDLFIILMSITLALRFRQITETLEKHFLKVNTEDFWREIREDYDRLSVLCNELDDNISYIILFSYTLNLFFLLIQLYQSLETVSGAVAKIYFIFSFIHIIFKIVCVSLYAAWINDKSIEPAICLNSVSSSAYNVEVKRLLMQISLDNVALTGCRMFKITRGIILSIAGAVVTYELVLIQFNSATRDN